jgi:hypothetical protein
VTADDAAAIEVTFTVRTTRMPLRVRKTMRLAAGAAQLTISESVTNEAAVPVAAMWGQHLAYGPPLVPGCRINIPNGLVVTPHPDPINPPERLVAAGGPWDWPVVPAAAGGEVDLSAEAAENGTALVLPPGDGRDLWWRVGIVDAEVRTK